MTGKIWQAVIATSCVATAVTMSMAGAAYAVDPPQWAVGGYHPQCSLAFAGTEPPSFTYVDNESPTVTLTPTEFVVVGNGAAAPRVLATLRSQDGCSGIAASQVITSKDGTMIDEVEFESAPADGNYFDITSKIVHPVGLADVGRYTFPMVLAVDRFDAFQLSADFKTLLDFDERTISPPNTISGLTSTDRYWNTASCVVRATTLSVTKNKKSIKKGKQVKVTGVVKAANGSSYAGVAGASVKLQRRLAGSKSWTTVGAGTTNGAGSVSIANKPKKTSFYRLAYDGKCAAPWTGPAMTGSTSKVKVKVKKK